MIRRWIGLWSLEFELRDVEKKLANAWRISNDDEYKTLADEHAFLSECYDKLWEHP